MNGKAKSKACNVIDLTKAPYTRFGLGIKRNNPKRCLKCSQSIKHGEAWSTDTSTEDPDGFGRYTVIRHTPSCPTPQAHRGHQGAQMRKGAHS